MSRVCIQFDECKPHWAEQRGYPKLAVSLGLANIKVTGDFDAKITEIYGDVENFEAFSTLFQKSALNEGSLHKVGGAK